MDSTDNKVMSYDVFKELMKKPEYFGIPCFVGGCHKPAEYEGGDFRFWCGMCEEHAGIKDRYKTYVKGIEHKRYIRKKWVNLDLAERR